MTSLSWEKDEKPEYAFCERSTAGPLARWHIRKLTEAGLKLGGGIDTPSLCKQVLPLGPVRGATGGWDINVRITKEQLAHACVDCCAEYVTATKGENK
jgi:hypothetical protein